MKLIVAAIGKMKQGPETELAGRYLMRAQKAGRAAGLRGPDVVELPESSAKIAHERKLDESTRLLAALPGDAHILALDETGKSLTSRQLATTVSRCADQRVPVLAFVIGGPDGHGKPLLQRAAGTLAFGAATWPHQLVRVMLAEQIYRSVTIMLNHPYHRD